MTTPLTIFVVTRLNITSTVLLYFQIMHLCLLLIGIKSNIKQTLNIKNYFSKWATHIQMLERVKYTEIGVSLNFYLHYVKKSLTYIISRNGTRM